MAADQLAVSGKAAMAGIPAATVAYGTPGNQAVASANSVSLTIFTKIDKSSEADIAFGRDNDNEVISMRRSNKTLRLSFSAKPAGATLAASQAIAAAIPLKGDVVVVTCANDAQIASTAAYVDSATLSYTPDETPVIDFVVIKYPNTFAVVAES